MLAGIFLCAGLLITAGYSAGFGPVCWVLQSESFPTAIRGRAMAVSVLVSNLGGCCTVYTDTTFYLCTDSWAVVCRSVRDEFNVSSADGIYSPQMDILHVFLTFYARVAVCELVYSGDEGETTQGNTRSFALNFIIKSPLFTYFRNTVISLSLSFFYKAWLCPLKE